MSQMVRAVDDGTGGTCITQRLHEFNQRWARCMPSGSATVLLIRDGLAHGDTKQLTFQMDRLHTSCKRLSWLN